MTSQRRSFFVVRSMEMMQTWEYTREARIMAIACIGITVLPRRRIMAPAEIFIMVRILRLRPTPIRTGMVATPVAKSPLRSLMSGRTEAINVQQKMNRNTTIDDPPGAAVLRYTGTSENASAHDRETTRFFITGISFKRRYPHHFGSIGTL
jgi:hypothetical protein